MDLSLFGGIWRDVAREGALRGNSKDNGLEVGSMGLQEPKPSFQPWVLGSLKVEQGIFFFLFSFD